MKLFVPFIFFLFIFTPAFSQVDDTELLIKKGYNKKLPADERVHALHDVAMIINNTNPDSALRIINKASTLLEATSSAALRTNNHLLRAYILEIKGNYPAALGEAQIALKLSEKNDHNLYAADAMNCIGKIYERQNNLQKALSYHRNALNINLKLNDPARIAKSMGLLANIYGASFQHRKAISIYQKSLRYIDTLNNIEQLGIVHGNIGYVYYEMGLEEEEKGNIDSAMNHFYPLALESTEKAITLFEGLETKHYAIIGYLNKGLVYNRTNDFDASQKWCFKALDIANKMKITPLRRDACECLYESKKGKGEHSEALVYYETYMSLKDSLVNKDRERVMLEKELGFNYEKKQLADSLTHANERATNLSKIQNQRIGLFSVGFVFVLLLILAVIIFKGKKRSDELLLNILPYETAQELKKKGSAEAKQFEHVSVLFTDFKGFTQIAESLSPTELVAEIDECFKGIDKIIEKYTIEKIKTIGDAYMAAGGLPVSNTSNSMDVVRAAFDILDFMEELRIKKEATGKKAFEIRIGIHTGPVIAGIVGIRKFAYDIWGDTVNTASRMESSGEVNKINISGSTYELVKDYCECTHRGKISAKNKGEIDMYFVDKLRD